MTKGYTSLPDLSEYHVGEFHHCRGRSYCLMMHAGPACPADLENRLNSSRCGNNSSMVWTVIHRQPCDIPARLSLRIAGYLFADIRKNLSLPGTLTLQKSQLFRAVKTFQNLSWSVDYGSCGWLRDRYSRPCYSHRYRDADPHDHHLPR